MPPLDSLFGGQRSFYQQARWQKSFAWWPHRCILSNQIIWMKHGYLGTAMYNGPDEPAYEFNWHTEKEHLIWCLRNGR